MERAGHLRFLLQTCSNVAKSHRYQLVHGFNPPRNFSGQMLARETAQARPGAELLAGMMRPPHDGREQDHDDMSADADDGPTVKAS